MNYSVEDLLALVKSNRDVLEQHPDVADFAYKQIEFAVSMASSLAPATIPHGTFRGQRTVERVPTQIPDEGIVVERRTEIHAVQEPPIKRIQRKFGGKG